MADRPLLRPSKPGWYELFDDDRLGYFDGVGWSSERLAKSSLDLIGMERCLQLVENNTDAALSRSEANWTDAMRPILGPIHDNRRKIIAEVERNWSDLQYQLKDEWRRDVLEQQARADRAAVVEQQAREARAVQPPFAPRQIDWARAAESDSATVPGRRSGGRGGLIAAAIAVAVVALIAVRVAGSQPSDSSDATARCVDGTLSFSLHHQGTCSHHGGVAAWLSSDDDGPDPADLRP